MALAPLTPTVGNPNGHGLPTLPPEFEHYPAMLDVVMSHARAELDARDVSAEEHARMWYRAARSLAVVLLVAILAICWLVWQQRDVQAFVQVVQLEGERLVQIGVPMKLLDYTPPEGAYQDMLAEWIRRAYWRGEDAAKAEKVDWRWVELHTCPSARSFLAGLKAKQDPGKKTPVRVQINVKSITRTPTPQSYQVLWEEVSTGQQAPQGKAAMRTTTFTVGRLNLKTMAEAEDNRLGLCAASFDTREHSQ